MTSPNDAPPKPQGFGGGRAAGIAVGLAIVAGFWFVGGVAGQIAAQPPLPGRLQGEAMTTWLAAVGDFVARVGALLTLGAFAGITIFTPMRPDGTLSDQGRGLSRVGAHAGQVWLWASILGTFAHSAYVNGVPMNLLLQPQAWWDFQVSSPSGLAWLLSALVALACTATAYATVRYAPYALCAVAGVLALTFVGVTGNVTVGLNHDWATDSTIWLTLAAAPLATSALGVLLLGHEGGLAGSASVSRRVGRYQRFAAPLAVAAIAGHGAVAWQQLAGTPATASLYGLLSIALVAVLALFVVNSVIRRFTGRSYASMIVDGVLAIAYVALLAAENVATSPRFVIPQSTQINYLGYEMLIPTTLERLLLPGRPNWLWIALTVVALTSYFWGVALVRHRGGRWPIARSITWTAGWLLTAYLAISGFWEYSTAVYSWHMFVHMTVNMLVPAFCVMGGPFTLIAAASKARPAGQLPGVAEAVDRIVEDRPFGHVFSPPVIWVNYVGSLFFIYYTPIFPWLMRYHWAHQLMLLYFMVTGYLFFNLIVGVDRRLHDLPHLVRLALVISIMPFHAIFAVGIMSMQTLIGEDFYKAIDVTWVGDLMVDQNIAGQITWILGEIPLFIVVIALAAQWFAHDRVENERIDKAVSSGEDHTLDAYNEMLAELAERDRASNLRRPQ